MSRKIRIGNDVGVFWTLKDADGNPYNLRGRDIAVEIVIGQKKYRVKELELTADNTIYFVYWGKDQKYTGFCDLKFIENDGLREMVTFDTSNAFTLVLHSWQAVDEGETSETIQIEVVSIASELVERVGPKGDPAGFGEVTAEIDANVGTPSVEVTASGPDTAKEFHFAFRNLKGRDGCDGSDADVTRANIEAALDSTEGKNLSTEDYTTAEKSKLAGVESGAEVNVLEGVQVNGTDLVVSGKKVNVSVPTALSQMGEDTTHRTVTDAEKAAWNGKQDAISDLQEIRGGAAAGASAYQKPSEGIPAADLASGVQTSLGKADTALQEHQSLASYVNGGSYNSTSKKIELKHDSTVLAEIDATAFIKDGMVDTVSVTGGNLVITFNTEAGKQPISIPLTDIFNPANYYDKMAADAKFLQIADGVFEKGTGTNSVVQKGSNNTAFGESAVVEGKSVTSAEDNGIDAESTDEEIVTAWENAADNKFSLAKGEASHIEGTNNLALAKNSHAEGNGTIAGNNSAHSEGTGSQALGKYSHAEGLESVASGDRSHSEGKETTASGNGSHAEGDSTQAGGKQAHAEGKLTNASKENSHAEGYYTTASENQAHAEGHSTTASGNSSHAEGKETLASGAYSHAEGEGSDGGGNTYGVASGQASHSEGSSRATGLRSHSEGDWAIASGQYSHAEGSESTASGKASHSEGRSDAIGKFSHAEGNRTVAGNGARKNKDTSLVEGDATHSEGSATLASGLAAHAEGERTQATGSHGSHAEGWASLAQGGASHSEGVDTIAYNYAEHAEGEGNASHTGNTTAEKTRHSIGVGTENARSNAVEVMQNGDVYIKGLGGYDGTNPSSASTLKQVIDAKGTYSKPSGGIPASDLASGVIPDISGLEDSSNKVTSLSASSTDTQYPSAKCVYDALYENVLISLGVNSAGTASDLIGLKVTVTNSDTSEQISEQTWNGTPLVARIKAGVRYTVSVQAHPDYVAPASQTFTSELASTRSVGFIYNYSAVIDLSYRNTDGTKKMVQDTANSYVARVAGDYKLPAVYGNAIKNGAANPATYTRQGSTYTADFVNYKGVQITSPYIETDTGETIASAVLLWQTGPNLISNVAFANGYVTFTVNSIPAENGLAVLAVKDENGNIMWSWTIWLTTDTLTAETFTNYTEVDYYLMPENLFCIWNEQRTNYGTAMIQWGRKDAFVPNIPGSGSRMTVYDIEGNAITAGTALGSVIGVFGSDNDQSTDKTVANSIKNPGMFFTRYDSTNNNWNNLAWFNNFWNAAGTSSSSMADNQDTAVKTIYDPCPFGWMLPAGRAFTGFTTTGGGTSTAEQFNVVGSWSNGWNFKRNSEDTVGNKFIASGCRASGSGAITFVGSFGYYWSFAPHSQASARYLGFNAGGVSPSNDGYRSRGFAVRPSRE